MIRFGLLSSVVAGIVGNFAAGAIFAAEAYRRCIHSAFNVSSAEAEAVFFMGLVGFGLGHPSALLNKKVGVMWLCVLGCSLSCVSQMLMWSAFRQPSVYINKIVLLGVYNLIAGHSLSYIYHCSIVVNCRNFAKKHRGKIMGMLHVPFGLSPVVLTVVTNEDSPGHTFLLMAGISVLAGLLCIIGLKHIPKPQQTTRPRADVRALTTEAYEYAPSDTGSPASYMSEDELPTAVRPPPISSSTILNVNALQRTNSVDSTHLSPISTFKLLTSFSQFVIPTICFSLGLSAILLWFLNLRSTLISINAKSSLNLCLLFYSIITGPTRVLMGVYTDAFKERLARKDMLVLGFGLYFISTAAGTVLYKDINLVKFMSASAGLACACLWSILPAQLSEMWGTRRMHILWATTLFIGVLWSIGVHYVFNLLTHLPNVAQYSNLVQCVFSLTCIIISRYPQFK